MLLPIKPNCHYGEVTATDRGWEVTQTHSGGTELLVSFPGLKTFLDLEAAARAEVVAPLVPEDTKPPVVTPPVEPPVDTPPVSTPPVDTPPADQPAPVAHTSDSLSALGMTELREIGATFDVRDTKKADLVTKILEAQAAKAAE